MTAKNSMKDSTSSYTNTNLRKIFGQYPYHNQNRANNRKFASDNTIDIDQVKDFKNKKD